MCRSCTAELLQLLFRTELKEAAERSAVPRFGGQENAELLFLLQHVGPHERHRFTALAADELQLRHV